MSLSRIFPELRLLRPNIFVPFDFAHMVPKLDMIETNEAFKIKADVPEFTKDQIDIDVQGNVLLIKGKVDTTNEHSDDMYLTQERVQSSFSRSLSLPFHVDPNGVKAELRDGVLNVMVPKTEAKSSKVTIESPE